MRCRLSKCGQTSRPLVEIPFTRCQRRRGCIQTRSPNRGKICPKVGNVARSNSQTSMWSARYLLHLLMPLNITVRSLLSRCSCLKHSFTSSPTSSSVNIRCRAGWEQTADICRSCTHNFARVKGFGRKASWKKGQIWPRRKMQQYYARDKQQWVEFVAELPRLKLSCCLNIYSY